VEELSFPRPLKRKKRLGAIPREHSSQNEGISTAAVTTWFVELPKEMVNPTIAGTVRS